MTRIVLPYRYDLIIWNKSSAIKQILDILFKMYYPVVMASIIKKIKKGRPYYYAVASQRVNGQPRIVWQKYLGTLDAILQKAETAKPALPKEAVIFESGAVAALLGIARRLQLMELINDVLHKRAQGPSVGQYMLLAALNRALAPCSKMAIGMWYEQTVLRRIWGFPKSAFSSQRFWDHMDLMDEAAIKKVQDRLISRIKSEFGIDPSLLLYDTTNFFTFLSTSNNRAQIPQRGHSKAKRHDLRQVGLALLATRDFHVPLMHQVYPGNIPDVSLFPTLSQELIARFTQLTANNDDITLVFDKGNVSETAMENFVMHGKHFVAALSANRLPEFFAVEPSRFKPLADMPGNTCFATTVEMWGKKVMAVVVYSESFFTQQLSGVSQNMVKCQKRLHDLQQSIIKCSMGKKKGKPPTMASVRKNIQDILSAQFMKGILKVHLEEKGGVPRLQYSVDHLAFQRLCDQRLGKTLIVTDHLRWTPEEVVKSYRSLSEIEEIFKHMKNIQFLHWQPAYHWTDQKLRVHGFYCVMALLLSTLCRKIIVQAGIDLSLPALLHELCAIREVALIYPAGALAHRKNQVTLSRMSSRQKKLAEVLNIAEILQGG